MLWLSMLYCDCLMSTQFDDLPLMWMMDKPPAHWQRGDLGRMCTSLARIPRRHIPELHIDGRA